MARSIKRTSAVSATYVSVWDDDLHCRSACMFDLRTKRCFAIDVLFECDGDKFYMLDVEAIIVEADPDYVRDTLAEDAQSAGQPQP